jgi:integrase
MKSVPHGYIPSSDIEAGAAQRRSPPAPGICALLGLRPFTPHDLRRTAATLAGDLGFDDAWIAKCLDHAASKKQEHSVPSVTGKVYNTPSG